MQRTKVQCPYCQRQISKSNISKHIRSHKNGNFDKWKDESENNYHLNHDDLVCKFCKEFEAKNKNSLRQHEIRCLKNPNKIDTSHSFGNHKLRNRKAWNKGLTKETDKRLKKASDTYNKNEKLGLHTNKPKHMSKDAIEKIKANPNTGGYRGKHSYEYNGIKLDSSYELEVAKSLDQNNIKWIRPKRLKYYEENDSTKPYHYYTPDFYLPDYDVYLEPKNDFLINNVNPSLGYKDIDKIKWVEQYHNIKVIILDKEHLRWEQITELIS